MFKVTFQREGIINFSDSYESLGRALVWARHKMKQNRKAFCFCNISEDKKWLLSLESTQGEYLKIATEKYCIIAKI